jgi:hypothetical protein
VSYARAIGRQIGRQTFSTKEFVPGHVLGAAILLFGTIALTRAVIARAADAAVAARARVQNERGQYGRSKS